MASRFMQEVPKKPLWKESPDEYFYRKRVTPLLPLSDIQRARRDRKDSGEMAR